MSDKSVTLEEFTNLFDPPVGTLIYWGGYGFERIDNGWIATGIACDILDQQHGSYVIQENAVSSETFPVEGRLPDGTSIVYDVPYKMLK